MFSKLNEFTNNINIPAFKHKDLAVAGIIISIIIVMILPMPSFVLDLGLTISLLLSVMVLMISLFISKPLDFVTFPLFILFTTLIRLALNISSTRLILTNGHTGTDAAGSVIQGFSSFVMGGGIMIGIAIFAVIMIVNFMVITKGAGRIAEVSARFTLDAMPGKQMAIDADLSAGLINEEQAKVRREELESESSFYSSMDGASKFVKGDAIAGLIITVLNIALGVTFGALYHDLSMAEAANTYAILTVGDGLVTQIPALLVSVGAGMLISRGASKGATGVALSDQIAKYPKALFAAAFAMFILGLVPGLPFLMFAGFATLLGFYGFHLIKEEKKELEEQLKKKSKPKKEDIEKEPTISDYLKQYDLEIRLGSSIVYLGLGGNNGLTDVIKKQRKEFAQNFGFILPEINLRDDTSLKTEEYSIYMHGNEISKGNVYAGKFMVIPEDENQLKNISGIKDKEPVFNHDVKWISSEDVSRVEEMGLRVYSPEEIISTHISEIVKRHMKEFVNFFMTRKLLKTLQDDPVKSEDNKKLIDSLIPDRMSINLFQRILQLLLVEYVSIRNLPAIIEACGEAVGNGNVNIYDIVKHVRVKLSLQITKSITNPEDGFIHSLNISSEWENKIHEALKLVEGSNIRELTFSPTQINQLTESIKQSLIKAFNEGQNPVILCSPINRIYIRGIVEKLNPETPVVSFDEIFKGYTYKSIGVIE